eukprot:UN08773
MSVNRLVSVTTPQPIQDVSGRRGNAVKPSPLNSFPKTDTKLYGPNGGAPVTTNDPNLSNNALPEQAEIIDQVGDIHANRYYNQTRNANLSLSSKYTNLSDNPINPNIKSSLDSDLTTSLNPTDEPSSTNILWDFQSDKQTETSLDNHATV